MNKKRSREKTRRKLLLGAAAITTLPTVGIWSKPVINAVLLPAHAQTSENPTPDPVGMVESFSFIVPVCDGPVSQGAEFFVQVDDGTFTIEIYTDSQNTDLSPRINSATATNVGTLFASVFRNCANDGSTGSPLNSDQAIMVFAYSPGVSVELQYEFESNTYVIPLNNNAVAPSCPIN